VATASNAEHIVIVTGSSRLADTAVASIPDEAIVIAVDGGLDHALAAGLHPSGLIGDLDSVSADGLAWAEQNATISRHPADKDDTDTELALRFVADMMPARLTMIGGGDRLDHTFAALGALGLAELTSIPVIDAWWGEQHVDVLHGPGQPRWRWRPTRSCRSSRCTGRALASRSPAFGGNSTPPRSARLPAGASATKLSPMAPSTSDCRAAY
jgi:hypothetical protein